MFIEPVATELVYQISDEEKNQKLKNHFNDFFSIHCANTLEPNATSEIIDHLHRHVSGIPNPFFNVILGTIKDNFEVSIEKQLAYFNEIETPFVWYIDEDSDFNFKEKLNEYEFQNIGTFQGVIGPLNKLIPNPEIPKGCTIELVKTETSMNEFIELICSTFQIHGETKKLYKKILWKLANTEPPIMFHWLAKKEGIAVSTVSTFIAGPIVSFRNATSLADIRRQGFNTLLWKIALKDAIERGCQFGISYLTSEGLALGICNQLGFEAKWKFNAFLAPQPK